MLLKELIGYTLLFLLVFLLAPYIVMFLFVSVGRKGGRQRHPGGPVDPVRRALLKTFVRK